MTELRTAHRALAALAALSLVLAAALVAVVGAAPAARAADLRDFDPGHIISDGILYDAGAMSAAQIQSFIVSKGLRCASTSTATCLRDFRQTTADKPADTRCTLPYAGARDETAAQIIAKVSRACGLNPQVLLVKLQKEQGLVTATTGKPASTYAKALGFACPDTAPCNARFAGFFNQVYHAAWRLRDYALSPQRFRHQAGRVNQVLFHPNAACGSSPVFIVNQATASLYNYTPYQPNAAALAAGYGTGDGCSAYGNRNFWNYFTDWFGSTLQRAPRGALDAVTGSPGTVTVRGWAHDPDLDGPIQVHVYVDGAAVRALTADTSRPDVAAAQRIGPRHGFVGSIGVADGRHEVCAYAIDGNRGPVNAALGCRTVVVTNVAPIGTVDAVTASGGRLTVRGWALDPDTSASIRVQLLVDGRAVSAPVAAAAARADVGAAYGRGSAHGYALSAPVADGRHTVCVRALDATSGVATSIGCREVTAVNAVPVGALDAVTPGAGTVTVRGFALDPDTSAPIPVHVYVDGRAVRSVLADGSRPDVGRVFGKGDRHGYGVTVPATDGTHQVCVFAIDASGGTNPSVGCRTVQVRNAAPTGAFTADASREAIGVQGWVADTDADRPLGVQVRLDGTVVARLTAQDAAPAAAGARRFAWQRAAGGPADHRLCVEAADASTGIYVSLGCRAVTVNGLPIGALDVARSTVPGTVDVSGWAIDPNTTDPIRVHVYVDGTPRASVASGTSRPDVAAAFGMGAQHGFESRVTGVASGLREVCVWAIDREGESNPLLGCRNLTVA